MLKQCPLFIFSLLFLSTYSVSSAYGAIDDELVNICIIVKNNDKTQLRRKLSRIEKDYRLKLGKFYHNVTCNNLSLLRYSVINKSNEAGILLTRKLPRSILRAPESDGQSIMQWAMNNGYDSSEIIDAVNKRVN